MDSIRTAFNYLTGSSVVRQSVKIGAVMLTLHTLRFMAEYIYFQQCSRSMMVSLFSSGSSSCRALRTAADVFSGNMAKNADHVFGLLLTMLIFRNNPVAAAPEF
jgi:hypothetical protein